MSGTVHADVEQVLDALAQDRARHPGVREAAVFGAPDDDASEAVHAAVVTRDDTVTAAGLAALVERQRARCTCRATSRSSTSCR